ncbi:MAG TPA: hypothetical protein VE573_03760 [Nitrososphaeraceae archaeon]|nr:hypothetical protein [Nitrososphaeraceae archaeon]
MKIALILEKQFHQKPKPEDRLHSSLSLLEQLTLEDISPIWASRLEKANLPIYQFSCHQQGCNGVLNYGRHLSML